MRLYYNGDAQGTLSQVSAAQKAEYDSIYRPINREMIRSVDSTGMVDSAKANANSGFDDAKARVQDGGAIRDQLHPDSAGRD